MPEQFTSSLTAKSRRFKEGRKGTEKLPTPDSHVDGENSAKTIVYNTKRFQRKEEGRKTKKSERLKKYKSKKKEFYTIDRTIRA